ncbi:hypothetical protein XBFM1_2370024 [Xenorhabdus bovienii str. feltiae Moldova]|uniref:Uncharacterized protein n=1 Tax=Xenorhabdus bovienii str. feltiae Moldova TaxID=1398200 RepID=A0A077NI99_XENBV|nr:hypothetical protein XBFM1_2370024 [Xenorhabdus bovienii str. feltiae Moldova]
MPFFLFYLVLVVIWVILSLSVYYKKNTIRTTYAYTFLFILVYCLVWILGFSPFLMVLLIIFLGIFHSSGLIVSQTWLMHEASEAPEFANSLYIAFSNLGIQNL